MVEMQETAELLKGIDAKSFVLVDEVGRGTSSGDGLALARAILEFLDSHVGGCTIFATHYHELAELGEKLGNVRNSSMQIKHWKGQLHFMRKLIPEPARSSYGIAVAKMAGVPEVVYARAQKLLQQPMTEIKSSASSGSSTGSPSGNPSGSSSGIVSGQIDLFNQVAEGAESSESSPKGLEGDPLELEQQPLVEHLGVEESRECLLEIEGMDVDDLSPREAWKKLADLQKKLRVN